MPALSTGRITALLGPYLGSTPVPATLYADLSSYLDLLIRWNARTNLTAIREPEEIVRRHFGESLFAGTHLAGRLAADATLLDFGSGAGFPGLPIQLLLPGLGVTLAESQNKKSTFLREVVRTLGLKTEIWASRAETMPPGRLFDAVALRAVDHMEQSVKAATARMRPGGWLVVFETEPAAGVESIPLPAPGPGYLTFQQMPPA